MNGSVPFESPRKRLCFRGDLRFFGLGYPPCGRRNDAQASAAACHSERNVLPVIRSGILALSFRADCHSCHSEERSDEESWRPLEGGKLSALLCGLKGVKSQPPPPPTAELLSGTKEVCLLGHARQQARSVRLALTCHRHVEQNASLTPFIMGAAKGARPPPQKYAYFC